MELMNNSRASISSTGALTVTGMMPYDSGEYSLNITNIGGTRMAIFSVFVLCKHHPVASYLIMVKSLWGSDYYHS